MIKKIIQTFIYVIAGITISAAMFITLLIPDARLTYHILWQIIGMAAVCACGNIIFYSQNEISKRQMLLRIIFHFLYINFVVWGGAYLWEWLRPGLLLEGLVMLLLITVVYAVIMIVTFRREERTAKDLNIRLRKYNITKKESEEDIK